MILWTLTILLALAGVAVRADHGFGVPTILNLYAEPIARGLLALAVLACPLLWSRSGVLPGALAIPGGQRFMMALALIAAAPLLLRWPF